MSDAAQQSIAFDRAAGYYDATRGFPPGAEDRVAALLAEAGGLGPDSRVLEIGIGTGRIALPLAARVGSIVGVDLSAPMLAQLVAKRGERRVAVLRADASHLPFRAACFDAVVGVHVFHLIPRWREVLAEIARVLRSDGLLLHAADDAASAALGMSPHRLAGDAGQRNVGVPRERLETFPEDEGFALAGPARRIPIARRLRPAALLDRLAKRVWSATWKLSDDELARIVDASRAELVARFGDLDREIDVETGFWVRCYRPPTR
jgi:SAM-dependent methyltransferase